MQYRTLTKTYEELASTSKRLEMTDILVELFKSTPSEIIDKVIFLTQGKLHPSWFELPETGIAEKSAIKAVSIATGSSINEIEEKVKEPLKDAKSRLQETVQSKGLPAPKYQVVQESGPDHSKDFVVEVSVNGKIIGRGEGKSKAVAEQEAAQKALESHYL